MNSFLVEDAGGEHDERVFGNNKLLLLFVDGFVDGAIRIEFACKHGHGGKLAQCFFDNSFQILNAKLMMKSTGNIWSDFVYVITSFMP